MSEENEEFVEVPTPEEVLGADLLNCRKLLKYCSPKITDDQGVSVRTRLEYMNAAMRLMRLQSNIAGLLMREGRLERAMHAKARRARKPSPARKPEPVHYDYGQWLADHPEEREIPREEKKSKTTADAPPRRPAMPRVTVV
jgi:hypothetical protein